MDKATESKILHASDTIWGHVQRMRIHYLLSGGSLENQIWTVKQALESLDSLRTLLEEVQSELPE